MRGIEWTGKLNNFTASTLSGILLVSIFPFWGKYYVAWVALIPLLWILYTKERGSFFFYGFWTGVIFFIGLIYWLADTMARFGGIPPVLSYLFLMLLCCYLALYIGAFAVLIRSIKQKINIPFCVLVPCLWVALEYIRSHFLTGFPWGLLGYSQMKSLMIVQIADITGVYGVSFFIVFVNAVLTEMIVRYTDQRSEKRLGINALALTIIAGMVVVYGTVCLKSEKIHHSGYDTLHIGLIQGNISQEMKRDILHSYTIIDEYGELSKNISESPNALIIWPETACTATTLVHEGTAFHILSRWAKEIHSYLLVGCPRYDPVRDGVFNSAILFSSDGEFKGMYDKIHLVPFGEYFPFQWISEKLVGLGSFLSGSQFTTLEVKGIPFSVIICFEAIFPDLCRRFVKRGARFLVNMTNDAWFGDTSAPYQHFDMACMRSVENRVWLIRSANTGISALVDPCGRVVKKGGIFERSVLEGGINPICQGSLYVKIGDLFALICLVLSALWCTVSIIRVLCFLRG